MRCVAGTSADADDEQAPVTLAETGQPASHGVDLRPVHGLG
jgi:hypothetical protein